METFSSLLAVSPRAGSENSLLRLSRGSRHRRRSGNSLRRDGNHTGRKISTGKSGGKVKIENETLGRAQNASRRSIISSAWPRADAPLPAVAL